MSFADRFKGKVTLVSKNGVISSIDNNINKSCLVQPYEPTPQHISNKSPIHLRANPFNLHYNLKQFSSPQSQPLPRIKHAYTPVSNKSAFISDSSKANDQNEETKPNKQFLQKIGYNFVNQSIQENHIKFFPSAPTSILHSRMSSKGENIVSINFDNEKDVPLFNSRVINYKPYTIQDYIQWKEEAAVLARGGLGPNIGSEEWKAKLEKRKGMIEFGNRVTKFNKSKITLNKIIESPKKESKREKSLLYARHIMKMVHNSTPMPSYSMQAECDLNKLQELRDTLSKKLEAKHLF